MIYYFCFHFIASEENAAKLRDDILAKTGKITDVVSCMGSWQKWWQKGPLLEQPVSDFTKVSLEYHNYNITHSTHNTIKPVSNMLAV